MNAIPSTLYTAAFTLCLFSAGILRERQSRAGRPHVFLTAFLVLEALGFVLELLLAHPAAPLKALWLALRMSGALLLAPCVWLALRDLVEETRPRLASLPRGHLMAVAAGALFTLPLLATAHVGVDMANPDRPVGAFFSRTIHVTMFLCMVVFAVQIPYYLLRCRRLLRVRERNHDGQPEGTTGAAGQSGGAWLHLPLLAVFATWAVGLARTFHCAVLHGAAGFAPWFALAEVSLTTCSIYLLANRASLRVGTASPRTVPVTPPLPPPALTVIVLEEPAPLPPAAPGQKRPPVGEETLPVTTTPADAVVGDAPAVRYAKSRLDDKTRQRIRRKLEAAMVKERLFCNSLLSLESLSRAVHENKHSVSQVLNQDLGESFFDFVARHRIEAAKLLLQQHPEHTILEIALAVGFNAKSTFNTAFRRLAGQTPTAYRSGLNTAPAAG